MADKDLQVMLARVAPVVDRWYFTDLPIPRAASAQQLQQQWLAAHRRAEVTCSTHASPEAALQEAIASANPADRILVFGSFYTVGGVLKDGIPRLHAKHLST
jgi:dihydrofolate synthase/folylpolyglutamate synthase